SKLLAPNNRDKLRLMLGDDAANELIGTLEQEKYLAEKVPVVLPNYNTGASGQTRAQRQLMFEAPQVNALSHWVPQLDLTNPLHVIPPALRPGTVAQDVATARAARIPPSLVPILLTPEPQVGDLVNAITGEGRRMNRVNSLVSRLAARPAQF